MNITNIMQAFFNKEKSIKSYWKNRKLDSDKHSPKVYVQYGPKEKIFLDYIIKNISRKKIIFEFGCNAGRCMRYLFDNGYKNLCGFDINENSIRLLFECNLEMAWKGMFISGELSNLKNIFKKFDVAISKGVLFNISPDQIKSVIKHLCKADTVIIFEGVDYGNFIHNYHKLFRNFGLTCVHEEYFPSGIKDVWKDTEVAKTYARKDAVYDKNKLLGVFKKNY